jgi:hypothetical protein
MIDDYRHIYDLSDAILDLELTKKTFIDIQEFFIFIISDNQMQLILSLYLVDKYFKSILLQGNTK